MNYLSAMIFESVNHGNWKPFKIRNHDLNISHLLFVDDVLFFAKANLHTISTIKHIIDSFYKFSEMEINLKKSKLWLSPHIPENRKILISNLLQINITSNLGTYLGYPLKPNYSSSYFNFIIHKLCQKLQGWKMHLKAYFA